MAPPLVEHLRASLNLPPGEGKITRTELAELLRLVEVIDRLRPYAAHRPDCGHHQGRPYGTMMLPGACTCGLQDVLSGRFAGEADPVSMRAKAEQHERSGKKR